MGKNPSRLDEGNPEWTEEDFRRARPALEVLPKEVVEAVRRYRGQRKPHRAPTKELINLRVDRDVVDAYRATGPGWQTRANEALRGYVRKAGLRRTGSSKREKVKGRARATPAPRAWAADTCLGCRSFWNELMPGSVNQSPTEALRVAR